MKKIFWVVLLLSILGKGYAFSPEKSAGPDSLQTLTSPEITPKSRFIWLNMGQLTQHELQLSYEKHLKNGVALEGTLGYKYPKRHNQEYDISMGGFSLANYYDYIFRVPYSTGLLGQLALKTNFPGLPGAYLSTSYFYRFWYFKNETLDVANMNGESDENFHSKMSLRMHVHGFKLQMGYPLTIYTFPGNKLLVLDFYGGLSFRTKMVFTDHKTYTNTLIMYGPPGAGSREPFTNKLNTWIISPQLGCKLGFNF